MQSVMIRLFVDKHPDTVNARHYLAQKCFKLDDIVGQRLRQEIELEILVRDLGADHPRTLAVQRELASEAHVEG